MRPACFVPTIETMHLFEAFCTKPPPNDLQTRIKFWSFPYTYCDRSNWNDISTDTKEFFDETHNRNVMMRAAQRRADAEDDESSVDSTGSKNSDEEPLLDDNEDDD